MALRLMGYSFKIKHKPGSENIADFLSRHPLSRTETDNEEEEVETYVAFIMEHAMPLAIKKERMIEATNLDETLSAVKAILSGETSKTNEIRAKEFKNMMHELTMTKEGLILRGTRILVPDC